MLKQFFGSRPTTKMDVILAAGAAVMAVANFISVKQQFKEENTNNEENQ